MSQTEKPEPSEADRRLRHNFRLARLLRMLQLVLGRGQWNPKNLMTELECSERTIHRMRETLELAGVPLWFSKEENAYRVRPDFRFPTLQLTDEEALGQGTASAVSGSEALHLGAGATATTRKLIDSGGEQARRILEDAAKLTEVFDLKIAGNSSQREVIRTVQWGLLQRKVLSGKYRSPYEPAAVAVKLHPYRLALVKQAWYLIARPDDEDRPRTYRIVRFQTLKMIDKPAVVPDDFDLTAYFGNAWAVYRGEPTYDIELRFAPETADAVLETTWHHTQKAKRQTDGGVTLAFQVDGLNEIVRWVVGWAGHVQVVKPPELRALVIDHHRKAIEANSQESDS